MRNKKGQQVDESNNKGLYQKKFVQDKWAILWLKMAHPDKSGSAQRIILKFCRMKGANRYMKIFCFLRKNLIWDDLIFLALRPFFTLWLGMVEIEPGHCYYWILISAQFMITAGSLNSQDMIRILKQSRHDFSGKHLYDEYCMDIMCCLCVEVKIHGFV